MSNLILRTTTSPYGGDTTKGSVLSQAELDGNFISLKGDDIYSAQTSDGTVTLKKLNGNDISFVVGSSGAATEFWTSGSSGNFAIKANNDSGLNATNSYAVAEGNATIASGNSSHAEGIQTTAGGQASHAEGFSGYSIGFAGHVEGYQSTASGSTSHAEGYLTTAGGAYSHTEGRGTTSTGQASHAEGYQTIALGQGAHSEGRATTASGTYSHAGGSGTTALGSSSFVHGVNSQASANGSIVLGTNITGATADTVYVTNFVILKPAVVPGSSADPIGENGQISWNDEYFFWKANGQWFRVSGSTF